MASAGEGCAQPRIGDGFSLFGGSGFRAHHQHIAVVVLARDLGGLNVSYKTRLNAGVAVRRDAHADARGAEEHPRIRAAIEHARGHQIGEVRVIHGRMTMRAQVIHGIAFVTQVGDDAVFQINGTVIGTHGYALTHASSLFGLVVCSMYSSTVGRSFSSIQRVSS